MLVSGLKASPSDLTERVEDDVLSWFEAWDRIPLGYLMWNCRKLSGIVKQRHALAGAIYTILIVYSENRKANRNSDYAFLRRLFRRGRHGQAAPIKAACH